MAYGSALLVPRPETDVSYKSVIPEMRKKKISNAPNLTFWRMFIIVAEIGLSMIPGVGTAGQVLIGLAGATANTLLSVHSDNVSGITVGLDYASAFIPAIMGVARATKYTQRINSAAGRVIKTATLNKLTRETTKKTFKNFDIGIRASTKIRRQGFKDIDKIAKLTRESNKFHKIAVKKSINYHKIFGDKLGDVYKNGVHKYLYKNWSPKEFNAMWDIAYYSNTLAGGKKWEIQELLKSSKKLFNNSDEILKKVSKKFNLSIEGLKKKIKYIEDTYKEIEKIPFLKRISKNLFLDQVEQRSPKELKAYMRELYNQIIKNRKQVTRLNLKKITNKILLRDLANKLSPKGKNIFNLFLNRFRNIDLNRKEMTQDIDALYSAFSAKDKTIISKFLSKERFDEFLYSFSKHPNIEGNKIQNIVRRLGRRSFNDKFVQRIQNVDANDFGRYFVERPYQAIKEKLIARYDKRIWQNAMKAGENNIKKSKTLDEAFVRSGGVLSKGKGGKNVINSRYILGYKNLSIGGVPDRLYVLVSFRKDNTGGMTGKNIGGKKDIVITATKKDYARLITEGTSYWFSVGLSKGWFVSRGGKQTNARNSKVISNQLSLFLGFVPIQPLKNVLSITTNWVENIHAMSEGTYLDNWLIKFRRAFLKAAVSRASRLTTKVIIGGGFQASRASSAGINAANKAVAGGFLKSSPEFKSLVGAAIRKSKISSAWFGRELQRFSTAMISVFSKTDSKGNFVFTDGSTRSRSTGNNLFRKLAYGSSITSLKSKMIRIERGRTGNRGKAKYGTYRESYGRQLQTSRLYLGQTTRVYSATTPNKTVRSLRSLTKIR